MAFGSKTETPQKVSSTSFLGKGTKIDGTFDIEGSVRIDGKLKGEIIGDADLIIGDGAYIEATIKVKNLTVMGEIHGNVICGDKLEIHNTGKLYGEISAKRLIIEENAIFEGKSLMAKEEKTPSIIGKETLKQNNTPSQSNSSPNKAQENKN